MANPAFSSSPLAPVPGLTPTLARKRRTRPSFSQVLTPSQESVLPTAPVALEFEEFSFIGADGSIRLRNISDDHRRALHSYLSDHFNGAIADYSEPFLVLGCDGDIPAVDERPFSVAGLIAIWKPVDDMYFHPFMGEWGLGEIARIDDPAIVEALEERKIPSDDVILFLADHVFLDCEALSLMWKALVVELPKASDEEFAIRLESCPGRIEGVGLFLQYHNGTLANMERRRRVASPNGVVLDRLVADEADYIEANDRAGQVYSSTSAGVLVQRDGEKRLTCSWHNWEDHDEKYPGKLGQTDDDEARKTFPPVQGIADGQPGTTIGYIRARMGDGNVALMQLDDGVVFENGFMEMDAVAKKLVPLRDLVPGDLYLIDSSVTGLQMLKGSGARFPIGRHPQPHLDSKCHPLTSGKGAYIQGRQVVFVTNTPLITSNPEIRGGLCGAVLLRCRDTKAEETEAYVLNRGEVCGMVHLADLMGDNYEPRVANFLVYADSFDMLMEDGWKRVQS